MKILSTIDYVLYWYGQKPETQMQFDDAQKEQRNQWNRNTQKMWKLKRKVKDREGERKSFKQQFCRSRTRYVDTISIPPDSQSNKKFTR